jgi:hypothetical protein
LSTDYDKVAQNLKKILSGEVMQKYFKFWSFI